MKEIILSKPAVLFDDLASPVDDSYVIQTEDNKIINVTKNSKTVPLAGNATLKLNLVGQSFEIENLNQLEDGTYVVESETGIIAEEYPHIYYSGSVTQQSLTMESVNCVLQYLKMFIAYTSAASDSEKQISAFSNISNTTYCFMRMCLNGVWGQWEEEKPNATLNVTENGTYNGIYKTVNVNVTAETSLMDLEYASPGQTYLASSYGVDGFSSVQIDSCPE